MRARSLANLGVAGAAAPDGTASLCEPALPDSGGRLGGTATAFVAADDRAAVRGGRASAGLKEGSAASAATFSAATFSDEANATVSSQVGGRVTIGGAGGGATFASGTLAGLAAAGLAAAGLAAADRRSRSSTSSGPGGVGAGMNAGSGPDCRPSSVSKNFLGVARGAGGAASGNDSHGCATAKAIASAQA